MRVPAFALLLLVACTSAGQGGSIQVATSFNILRVQPAMRNVAPPVTGEMLAGDPVDLGGNVAVVNFWGSWCGPCREEQPRLEATWKRYADRGVVFVGVNTRRDQRAAALAFLEEFDVTYPSVYDPASEIAFEFGVRFMPATFVIDRQGRIAAQVVGALRAEDDLTVILDEELAA